MIFKRIGQVNQPYYREILAYSDSMNPIRRWLENRWLEKRNAHKLNMRKHHSYEHMYVVRVKTKPNRLAVEKKLKKFGFTERVANLVEKEMRDPL